MHRSPSAPSSLLEDDKNEISGVEMVETASQAHEVVEEGTWASAKKNPKVILYSISACVSSMLWGFDIGENSPFYQVAELNTEFLICYGQA